MAIGNESSQSNLVKEYDLYQRRVINDGQNQYTKENSRPYKERFQCPKCDKNFGHQQVLQLHLKVHQSGIHLPLPCGRSLTEEKIAKDDQTDTRGTNEPRDQLSGDECKTSSEQIPTQHNSSPVKKVVGLTKIRLEDCLRCDACSCIYIDENDYNKHMKNFHRQDSPKKHKQKKGCRSCCKHCNCRGNHQQPSVQKERGNNNLFHYNIKDRWTKMVSRRLNPKEIKREIKPDPDGYPNNPLTVAGVIDYSHLLSQVEVKIKTEPSDLEY